MSCRATAGADIEADAIRELKYRYCRYFDEGNLEGLLGLFTDDAVCDLGPFGNWRGTAQLRAGYANQMRESGVPGARLHSVTNPLITIDGDRAAGRWYLVDYDTSSGCTTPVRIIANYDDTYRREGGCWLIERATLSILWRAP